MKFKPSLLQIVSFLWLAVVVTMICLVMALPKPEKGLIESAGELTRQLQEEFQKGYHKKDSTDSVK